MAAEQKQKEFPFSDKEFEFLSSMVKEKTGIMLPLHKKSMVYSRLTKRLRTLKIASFDAYCKILADDKNEDEMLHCLNAVTTNLTGFFREEHHFDHLEEIIKELESHGNQGTKRLRIWSSACSSGQEPYSIAMTLMESMTQLKAWDVKILATDIDTNMVETAKRGVYPEDMLEKIPKKYHKKYVIRGPEEGTIQMSDSLRNLITFRPMNLLHEWPFNGPFDAVFCRNVVIYFDKPTQRTLFNKMADKIKDAAWLYIGHSESLFKVSDRFELMGRTIYKRIT